MGLLVYLLTYLLTYLLSHRMGLLAYLLTYLLAYLLTYLLSHRVGLLAGCGLRLSHPLAILRVAARGGSCCPLGGRACG